MQLATKEQALAAHFEVLEGANTWDTSSCLNRSHQHYRILASEFKESEWKFTENVKVQHDEPFTLTPGDFFKLPLEMRTEMYKLVLKRNDPIYIDGLHLSDPQRNRHWYGAPKGPLRQLALLLVNKQILQETIDIVYRDQTFQFFNCESLHSFLARTPTTRKELRSIKLCRAGESSRFPFGALLPAEHLQSITFARDSVYFNALSDSAKVSMGDLSRELVPFLQRWQAAHTGQDNVLDVLKFERLEPCVRCRGAGTTRKEADCKEHPDEQADKRRDRVVRIFREKVARQLQVLE